MAFTSKNRLVPRGTKIADEGKVVAYDGNGRPTKQLPQAGGILEATRASVEDPATTVADRYVSPRRLWAFWSYVKGIANTFTGKITMDQPPRITSLTANQYLKLDGNKDVTSTATILAGDVTENAQRIWYTPDERATLSQLTEKYRGTYPSLNALRLDHPEGGQPGWEAQIDNGLGDPVKKAAWDESDNDWYLTNAGGATTFPLIGGNVADNPALVAALGAKQNNIGYVPENVAAKDSANGYAGLNANGKIAPAKIEQDANNRLTTDAEKATYAGKQDALGASATATQISTTKRVRVGSATATNNMFDVTSDGLGDIMNLRRSDNSSAIQLVSNGNGWNATSTSASWGAEINASTTIGIRGKSYIYSVSDGNIQFMNNASNGFTSMNLGPRTAAFPMLEVNGSITRFKRGDGSGYSLVDVSGVMIAGVAPFTGTFTDLTGKVVNVIGGVVMSAA